MIMLNIAKRNILLFFRDKTAVFFSLLSVFIIIGLYVLFLGNLMVANLKDVPEGRFLMDSWIVAGLVAVSTFTAPLGAYGQIIDDHSKNVIKDFTAAPLKKSSLTGGYIISAFVIGVIVALVTLVLGEVYILINGGKLIPLIHLLGIIFVIIISTLANSAILYYLSSYIKSSKAFVTFSTICNTLIGFIMGIYIPIGALPTSVQTVIKIFPSGHSASLLRRLMMENPMKVVFSEAPVAEVNKFVYELGVRFSLNGKEITASTSIIILLVTATVFYSLSLLKLRVKKK